MLGMIDTSGPHIVAKLIFGSILKQPAGRHRCEGLVRGQSLAADAQEKDGIARFVRPGGQHH